MCGFVARLSGSVPTTALAVGGAGGRVSRAAAMLQKLSSRELVPSAAAVRWSTVSGTQLSTVVIPVTWVVVGRSRPARMSVTVVVGSARGRPARWERLRRTRRRRTGSGPTPGGPAGRVGRSWRPGARSGPDGGCEVARVGRRPAEVAMPADLEGPVAEYFAINLREAREARGGSQVELAQRVKTTSATPAPRRPSGSSSKAIVSRSCSRL